MKKLLFLLLLLPFCVKSQPYPGYPPDVHDQQARKTHNIMDYGGVGDSTIGDSLAFARAVAAANADSGVVYIPSGRYLIGTQVDTVGPAVTIEGDYRSTVIFMRNQTTLWLKEGCIVKNLKVTIDTSYADSTENYARLYFVKSFSGGAMLECGADHLVLDEAYLYFNQCTTGFFATNNIIRGADTLAGGGIVTANDCKNGWIAFNKIHDCGKNGIMLNGASKNILITGNDIHRNGHSSVFVMTNSTVPDSGFGIIIENNWLHDNPVHNGIDINPDGYADYLNIIIRGNYIYNNYSPGIYVNGSGVTIENNRIFLNGQEGVRFLPVGNNPSDSVTDTLSRMNLVQGNYFYNNGTNNDGSDYELQLNRVAYSAVIGNYFRRDSVYAIGMDQMIYASGVGNYINGNYFFEDSVNGARAQNYDFISYAYTGHAKGAWDSMVVSGNYNQKFLNDTVYFDGSPYRINDAYLRSASRIHMGEDKTIGQEDNYIQFDSSNASGVPYMDIHTGRLRFDIDDTSNKYFFIADNNLASISEYLFCRAFPNEFIVGSNKNSGDVKSLVIGVGRTNAGDIVSNMNSIYIEGGVWASDSIGNVGIKTEDPNYDLEVNGIFYSDSALLVRDQAWLGAIDSDSCLVTKWYVDGLSGTGEVNTLSDSGVVNNETLFGLSTTKDGTALKIKTLAEGTNVTIDTLADSSLQISASGGGGFTIIDDTTIQYKPSDSIYMQIQVSGKTVTVTQGDLDTIQFGPPGQTLIDSLVVNGFLVDATGTTTGDILEYSGTKYVPVKKGTPTKSFVIASIDNTFDFPFWQTPEAITITAVSAVCTGGTNVVGALQEYNATGTSVDAAVDGDWTITTSEYTDASFTNAGIDAGDWIGWKTTSVSGTVTFFSITFEYTID